MCVLVNQVKESRKQNRLLKIAISKLQNDFERVARHTQHPIEISYSLHENDRNNLLEQLERVIEDNKDEELNNQQILDKLEETNQKMKQIADAKINSYNAYADDQILREKLSQSKLRVDDATHGYRNKSFHKYESTHKKLIYSPMKNANKKPQTRELPVGSAQKVSSIKKKLGGNEKWNQFCSEILKDPKTQL